jgi:hypothetical protein
MKARFALCIDDGGYPEALEKRKFYELVDDTDAENEGLFRVIDESGESYLYSKDMFLDFSLPQKVEEALKVA